jgi:hypothetical protein
VTALTTFVESAHPTITTLRSPAFCADEKGTVTVSGVPGGVLCGTAELLWTYAGAAASFCGKKPIPAAMKKSKVSHGPQKENVRDGPV